MPPTDFPSAKEFERGHREYERRESRDAMYKTASFLVNHFWGHPAEIADSLGVLLLTWNQAFYRYGSFDFNQLERCIEDNQDLLNRYRSREITTFGQEDEKPIVRLFDEFLVALRIANGTKAGAHSPVAVAKALHLLAPMFFPLWDDKIAREYGCHYAFKPAVKYLEFVATSRRFAETLRRLGIESRGHKTLLKLIDEYNYAKYTQKWI
jgi:hypothetical protein